MLRILQLVLLVSSVLHNALAKYVLVDDYSAGAFWSEFNFFTDPDPTNGHVQFLSMAQANATGLVGFMQGGNTSQAIYMGVDSTSAAPNGRGAIRVQSQKTYQHALVVADIVHMPGGVCGTWPAFWMVGDDWPSNGEIDIVEGVNDGVNNQMTLHTNAGSSIAGSATNDFTGRIVTQNCDVDASNQDKNAGCGILDESGLTFGQDFNKNGGGVYAMEWTSDAIKIWFWPRGAFPGDLSTYPAQPAPNTDSWGLPKSIFTGADVNIDQHFHNLRLVFDTTFCGDWAGAVWTSSPTCSQLAPTCEEYVSNNPAAFEEAYWAINNLMVWQDDGTSAAVASQNYTINMKNAQFAAAGQAVNGATGTRLAMPATASPAAVTPAATGTSHNKRHQHGYLHRAHRGHLGS